jgi:hypothetical protein
MIFTPLKFAGPFFWPGYIRLYPVTLYPRAASLGKNSSANLSAPADPLAGGRDLKPKDAIRIILKAGDLKFVFQVVLKI